MGINFVEGGEVLPTSGLVDALGVNYSFGNPAATLTLDVVAFYMFVLYYFDAAGRMGVSVSCLNLCNVFFSCLKMHGHGFEAVH